MDKLKLLILYGGVSEEHPVSIKSARELSRNLNYAKYDPVYVFIGRDGLWRLTTSVEDAPESAAPVALSGEGLLVLRDGRYDILHVDAAFPILHGSYGEDGTVQGALQMAGIPYVGCGIAASALCIDKSLTYMAASSAGVAVPRYRLLLPGGEIAAAGLSYPLFVKPCRSGSSFGVSKVTTPRELPNAVQAARQYDDRVLLEEAVQGLEIGCAILGEGDDLVAGALDQIDLSGGFFRIHQEEKPEQGSENATFRVPAPIPEESRDLLLKTAKTVYCALQCSGLARVDMFLTPENKIVLNEVNTMPGLTSYSRYPRMMAAAGIPLPEVVDRLIGNVR